jgi:hypothetical protein
MVHDDWAFAAARDGMLAMNVRDWAAFESLYAPNVVYERPRSTILRRRTADRYGAPAASRSRKKSLPSSGLAYILRSRYLTPR